ncbi:MAG: protein phosphatase 2C domain-containing protein [Nitrospira sp.]
MDSFTIQYGATSDTGLKRRHNEDRFCADPVLGLYLVCDGMGGHRAGEIASAKAVETIHDHIAATALHADYPLVGVYRPEFSGPTNRLASAVRAANLTIYQESLRQPCYAGMGTTTASILISGQVASIAHVGDSRVYLIRDGTVQALTCDHSLISEQVRVGLLNEDDANQASHRHVLTRAVGVGATVDVELAEVPLLSGDLLLLCTDGLSCVPPAQLLRVSRTCTDPQTLSDRLIAASNAAGGDDNITAVVVAVIKSKTGIWARLQSHLFNI